MKGFISFILCIAVLAGCSEPDTSNKQSTKQVVPGAEKDIAQQKQMSGPSKTTGIKSVDQLGTVSLAKDFPQLADRIMRARKLTIEPSGVVAVHQHEQRPGLAYILSGEIYEHRPGAEPVLKKAGDISFEQTGVVHYWQNKSGKNVEALVVDIVPQ